jgi:RNA polymerase sigma factor (sigma-70 family)
MPENSRQTLMQQWLVRAGGGDASAIDALLRHSCDRLTLLTRRMLGDFPRVRRWTETSDVLQNALVRLMGALRDVKPQSAKDFLALAALQIRRELIDLARQYYGPHGIGANYDSRAGQGSSGPKVDQADLSHEPGALAQWSELHQHIDALPEEEREVVGLLFYQGMAQQEAAEVLNISVRTLQRRWHSALCKLHRVWKGE